jgi:hypothetical protein
MAGPDPLSWIRELSCEPLWPYGTLGAFVRAYLHADRRRRAEARAALPGIAEEAALWRALRAAERRN